MAGRDQKSWASGSRKEGAVTNATAVVHESDPTSDPGWAALVQSHPRASVFHSLEWLRALRTTHGYAPTVFTTSPPGQPLEDGIVFCRVESWLTGSRLVSLPFSDHCDLLVGSDEEGESLLASILQRTSDRYRYLEVRPRNFASSGRPDHRHKAEYYRHAIDLMPDLDELYSRLHKSSIRRKISRADREQVTLDCGRSDSQLLDFYRLMLLTRRRHRVPPPPLRWFRTLVECFGDKLAIRVARKNARPIAAMITLRHKRTLTYKYGCSDAEFHRLGGVPRLFWEAIRDAKSSDLVEFDLGRSDIAHEGLIRFKEHLGATCSPLTYWTVSDRPATRRRLEGLPALLQKPLSVLPDRLFRLTGEIFYPHAG